jgi:hypothetical protein
VTTLTPKIQPTVTELLKMSAQERKLWRNDLCRREMELADHCDYLSGCPTGNDNELLMELFTVTELLEVIRTIS